VRIYLLRHAIAEARNSRLYHDDKARPLSAKGKQKMRAGARGMVALGLSFDVALTSPLARAKQTARIVARILRPFPSLSLSSLLAPGASLPELLRELSRLPARSSVLLVGHEPDLSRFASLLVLGPGRELPLDFKKGGLCRIDFPGIPRAKEGNLFYHLSPRILRKLGRAR
jgi:phosphohistidine phosphatase